MGSQVEINTCTDACTHSKQDVVSTIVADVFANIFIYQFVADAKPLRQMFCLDYGLAEWWNCRLVADGIATNVFIGRCYNQCVCSGGNHWCNQVLWLLQMVWKKYLQEVIPPFGGGTSIWRWHPPIGGGTSNWRWDSAWRWDLHLEVTPPIGAETSKWRSQLQLEVISLLACKEVGYIFIFSDIYCMLATFYIM